MKVSFDAPKEVLHENPALVPGGVYRMVGANSVYIGIRIVTGMGGQTYLINVDTGQQFSDYGFGSGKFVDVTDKAHLIIKDI